MSCCRRDVGQLCSVCGRPPNLYGNLDIRTGWEGWCSICNAHWHLQKAKVLREKTESYLKEVASTNVFVVSGIASSIACYIACPEYELRLIRRAQVTLNYIEMLKMHVADACRTAAGSAAEPGTDGPDGCVAESSDWTRGNLSAVILKLWVPPF